jgi:hypothetical protein
MNPCCQSKFAIKSFRVSMVTSTELFPVISRANLPTHLLVGPEVASTKS